MKVNYKIILLSTMACLSSTIYAQAFLTNDNNLRTDLNWLNQQGVIQLSTSTWPLSTEEVTQAIKNAKVTSSVQQQVIDAVQAKINEGNNTAYVDLATATTQNKLPSSFGDSNTAQSKASFTLQQSAENWDAHLQLNLEANQRIRTNSPFNVNGSYIAGKLWNQWVSFGEVPTWWGPGHDGSLIRGDATRPVPGFMVQRAEQKAFETKWLSWIGPWQYQLFAGQLQHYMAVPNANLLGMRLTTQPLPYLELGASRTLQIDGRGQPDGSSAYWHALIGDDNNCSPQNCINNENASNQLGGIDARLNLKSLINLPLSIYGQMIGEDESGKLPSRNLYLAGIDFSSSIYNKPYQVYTEWADTRTDGHVLGYTYNHHQYTDGYYQYGYPIGHAMGGDGQMYALGGNIQLDAKNRITSRILYAKVNQSDLKINYAFNTQDNIKALDLGWNYRFNQGYEMQVNTWVGQSKHYNFNNGISLSIRIPIVF